MNYRRTPTELKKHATLFWPRDVDEKLTAFRFLIDNDNDPNLFNTESGVLVHVSSDLAAKEQSASIIPKLIATQDKFISVLHISDSSPDAWKGALAATNELYANLFLKHLMVLADIGGEPMQRIKSGFKAIYPHGTMKYSWKGRNYEYRFRGIPTTARLTNRTLHVDGKHFHKKYEFEPVMEDVVMLLLHGAASQGASVPDIVRERCVIGALMGERTELEKFVKQRYIWVNRITGGTTSNAMGQIAQDYVRDTLSERLLGSRIDPIANNTFCLN
jgi:hypothetical protein